MADGEVIGLTVAKINGSVHVDVKNARWSVKRADQQIVTGGGVVQAVGEALCSGSFDEVVPKSKGLEWKNLRLFSIEIFDKETRSIVIASFRQCNWNGIDGSSDNQSANTGKNVAWLGNIPVKF